MRLTSIVRAIVGDHLLRNCSIARFTSNFRGGLTGGDGLFRRSNRLAPCDQHPSRAGSSLALKSPYVPQR